MLQTYTAEPGSLTAERLALLGSEEPGTAISETPVRHPPPAEHRPNGYQTKPPRLHKLIEMTGIAQRKDAEIRRGLTEWLLSGQRVGRNR